MATPRRIWAALGALALLCVEGPNPVLAATRDAGAKAVVECEEEIAAAYSETGGSEDFWRASMCLERSQYRRQEADGFRKRAEELDVPASCEAKDTFVADATEAYHKGEVNTEELEQALFTVHRDAGRCNILRGKALEDTDPDAAAALVTKGRDYLLAGHAFGDKVCLQNLASFLHNRGDRECIDLWVKGSKAGDTKCTYNLGMLYLNGDERIGIEVDVKKAYDYLEQAAAAKHGSVDALFETAKLLATGVEGVVAQDLRTATARFLTAAQHNRVEAFGRAAQAVRKLAINVRKAALAESGGKKTKQKMKDMDKKVSAKMLTLLKSGLDAGDLVCATYLAQVYLHGFGSVKRSDEQAVKYYRIAAQGGNTDGMAEYAKAILSGTVEDIDAEIDGMGVEEPEDVAIEYLVRAAAGGHAEATHNLAGLYMQKYEERTQKMSEAQRKWYVDTAMQYYDRAAAKVPQSAYAIGAVHSAGMYGRKKDHALAASYFLAGALNGDLKCQNALLGLSQREVPNAMYSVHLLHEMGALQGIPADKKESTRLLKEAAALGHKKAIKDLKAREAPATRESAKATLEPDGEGEL